MPCAEIVKAIEWNKQTTTKKIFRVMAYLTRHYGYGITSIKDPAPPKDAFTKDYVHYASGWVRVSDDPLKSYLKGTLEVSSNTGRPGEIVSAPQFTYDVEIFPDGTLNYVIKAFGNPVTTASVHGTCVNDVLLTATHPESPEVITVGVTLEQAFELGPS